MLFTHSFDSYYCLFLVCTSNLGVLQPVVEQSVSPAEDPYAMQRVSPDR